MFGSDNIILHHEKKTNETYKNFIKMGAAGNKKPKKAKAGKHEAKYAAEESMNNSTKGQKKKLH